jgi:hypothetical protein
MNLGHFIPTVVILVAVILAIFVTESAYPYRDDDADLNDFNNRNRTWAPPVHDEERHNEN